MRQFLSLRYWMTLLALLALAGVVAMFASGSGSSPAVVPVDTGVSVNVPAVHQVDLLQWVFSVQAPGGVAMVNGRTTADIALVFDATRTMMIKAGTPGEWNCPLWQQQGQCAVAADLLGDAVLWFSVVPGVPGTNIKLPAVVELLADNTVRLSNGWVVRRASVVERSCDTETTSLKNFVDSFGESASSTFDFEQQKLVKVTCPRTGATTTTTIVQDTTVSTVPDTSPGGSTTSLEPG